MSPADGGTHRAAPLDLGSGVEVLQMFHEAAVQVVSPAALHLDSRFACVVIAAGVKFGVRVETNDVVCQNRSRLHCVRIN